MTRIAIHLDGGYVPGLNTVIHGAVRAAAGLGWEVIGLHDGFDGLLFPERYPEGGTIPLTPRHVEPLSNASGCLLGTAPHADPFRVQQLKADAAVCETDRSDELLAWATKSGIEAVISVADSHALGGLWKLERRGLRTLSVPQSPENDIAATDLAFGFSSVLDFTVDILERAREAAAAAGRIGVVEVPGLYAGWLALQSAIAVGADAALLPEIRYDLSRVAEHLSRRLPASRGHGLVVVAEGSTPLETSETPGPAHFLKSSLSPGATGPAGARIHVGRGQSAKTVAEGLQRRLNHTTQALDLGRIALAGPPSSIDRQLGMSYGAAAVQAVQQGRTGSLMAFQAPHLDCVPLEQAVNRHRTIQKDCAWVQVARSLGICLGD
ncbi:MAG: 6-phosphofructokinase [Verrucomicrobiales bacterium]|nr:6-phosphofructokinase [Verrucomicrobiales bacterium]